MPQQPDLKSSPFPANPAPLFDQRPMPAEDARQAPPPRRIPRWLERSEQFLRILIRLYIGLALCYAPWSHVFWDQNPLFLHFPTLSIVAANGAVRGMVSGLGLLNLWIALHGVLRRHQD